MTRLMFTSLSLLAVTAGFALGDSMNNYTQTNLTSNLPGLAAHQDPNLVNPGALVAGPPLRLGCRQWQRRFHALRRHGSGSFPGR